MTTQHYPIEELDPRIPRIIELRSNGLTWTQVSKEMDLSRKQIYNIRQQENFQYITLTLVPKALKILEEGLNAEGSKSDYIKMAAVKEVMMNWRSQNPKRIESKSLNVNLTMEETREGNQWIEHMTPEDFKEFQDMKTRALQHMSPTPT